MNNDIEVRQFLSKDRNIRKFLFVGKDKKGVFESSSFFTPDRNLYDICVSTMAGCPMSCKICSTTYSPMPFEHILTVEEICTQISVTFKERNIFCPTSTVRIGFMGNGEPFGNYKNMAAAIERILLVDKYPIQELAISTTGINISHIKDLFALSQDIGFGIKLQLSLYSLEKKVRQELLPLAPELNSILPFLDWYAKTSKIPIRYNVPLIQKVNNMEKQLLALRDFLLKKPQERRLKLSAFNIFPGSLYCGCSDDEISKVAEWFNNQGVRVDIFWGHRDETIFASCGQMRSIII